MDQKQMMEALGKPQLSRLKALGVGIEVGRVLGNRVLVKTVIPFTDLDRVEKEGKLVMPEWVKKENTPLPTTGMVVKVGWVNCVCGKPAEAHAGSIGGPWHTFVPAVNEGDMIMFGKFAGLDFMIEANNYRIVNVDDILAVLVDTQQVVAEVAE